VVFGLWGKETDSRKTAAEGIEIEYHKKDELKTKGKGYFMCIQQATFEKGDWIVHPFYGIGQISSKVKKRFEGKKQIFYMVKKKDGKYWINAKNTTSKQIRPLSSKAEVKQALTIIQKPPAKLLKDKIQRRKKFIQAVVNGSLFSEARLIRDLHGKKISSKLDYWEETRLKMIKDQFLCEWSMVNNEDRKILEERLKKALIISVEKSSIGEEKLCQRKAIKEVKVKRRKSIN